uniref:Putative trypsin-like serine protease n=1 Tax=Culex tarsalis TaxID=7177 RepID=A0A1Q3FHD4_CULTA
MFSSSYVLLFSFIAISQAGALPGRSARIVGGSDAAEGQFPYQVSLRSAAGSHFCGGSIVNSRWILTAGHCAAGRTPVNTVVVVDTLTLNAGGTAHVSDVILVHPQYAAGNLANDLAVIRVAVPIVFNNRVGPISLAPELLESALGATVSGWGQTATTGLLSNHLQYANVDIITREECLNSHGADTVGRIHEHSVCASSPAGVGVCMGDGGSPLTFSGLQQGIVSWGVPCGTLKPDVYTRVSPYRTWITQNTVE